jgi:hypothetical protein
MVRRRSPENESDLLERALTKRVPSCIWNRPRVRRVAQKAELVLGVIADTLAIIRDTIIPPPSKPDQTPDKMRPLQLSAIFAIVVLGLLLNTMFAGMRNYDTLPFLILTLLYFTVASWIFAGVCWIWGKGERPRLVNKSLSLVIGFSAISITALFILREIDVFHRIFPHDVKLQRLYSVAIAVAVAAVICFLRSLYATRMECAPFEPWRILVTEVALMAIAGFYLFFIA